MLTSPAALFAGLAERVGQRSVCRGAYALVWVLLPPLLYLSAVCCWHGGFASSQMPLPGVVSPLCVTRWGGSGEHSPSAHMHGMHSAYNVRAVHTRHSVHSTGCTHMHPAPHTHGAETPLCPPGKARPFCTGVICAAIPAPGGGTRVLSTGALLQPCRWRAAGERPGPALLLGGHAPCPPDAHTRPRGSPAGLQALRAVYGGARGCGWPRGDDAGGGRAGGRE